MASYKGKMDIYMIVIGVIALVALILASFAVYKEEKYTMPMNQAPMNRQMPPQGRPSGRHPMFTPTSPNSTGEYRCHKDCMMTNCAGKGDGCSQQCMFGCKGLGSDGLAV